MHLKKADIFLYSLFVCLVSCNSGMKNKSAGDKYVNHSIVTREKYKSDSLVIVYKLMIELQNQEAFFDNSSYNGLTQIIIDSIIYSPDYMKIAAFVVVKNSTKNQLYSDTNHAWYYDGTCYLGRGVGDSLKLYWVGPGFTQSDNDDRISSFIRDHYFRLNNTRDSTQPDYCKYNLDDIRFWTCSIWDDLIIRDEKKKAFEEERIKHPENVYDPKRSRY
jgi:hypothetical protein